MHRPLPTGLDDDGVVQLILCALDSGRNASSKISTTERACAKIPKLPDHRDRDRGLASADFL
jgi:hypothetical protein